MPKSWIQDFGMPKSWIQIPWSQRLSFILYWQILRRESLLNFFLLARSADSRLGASTQISKWKKIILKESLWDQGRIQDFGLPKSCRILVVQNLEFRILDCQNPEFEMFWKTKWATRVDETQDGGDGGLFVWTKARFKRRILQEPNQILILVDRLEWIRTSRFVPMDVSYPDVSYPG